LPADKLKFAGADSSAKIWDIPALGVDQTFIADFVVYGISNGEAITNINISFDQLSDSGEMIETITFVEGVGGGPEKQTETTTPEITLPVIESQATGEGEVAGTGETGETEQEVAEENLPEIKGEQIFEIKDTNRSGRVWWNWLLIIFLFIIINSSYFLLAREKE